jgi:hypothetical protein
MADHIDDRLFETEITDCVCRSCLGGLVSDWREREVNISGVDVAQ